MNRNSSPPRSYLTEFLVNVITTGGIICFPYEKPDGSTGGWTNEPGLPGSQYIPYSMLHPLPAGDPQGSLADSGTEWDMSYSLNHYGVSGTQVERQSDKIRKLWSEIPRGSVTLGTEKWNILKARPTRIGGVVPNKSGTKTVFEQNDTVIIHISKGKQ